MKKIMALLCFFLLGIGLVSCKDAEDSEGEYEGEKKIVFWHTMGDRYLGVLDEAIEKFEQANEGWEIESVPMGAMDAIVQDALKNSKKPDLVFAYPEHTAKYKEKNLIVDMMPFIQDSKIGFSTAKINDFVKAFYDEGKAYGDDGMWSLPFAKASEVLYYSKLDANESFDTWEEFAASNEVLQVESPSWLFTTLAHQSGATYTSVEGTHYAFDNTLNRDNVEMLKEWYRQGKLNVEGVEYTQFATFTMTTSTAVARYLQNPNIQVAPLPTFTGKERKVPFQGPSLCMMKQHKEKMEKTWTFIKEYLLDSEFQAKYSMATLYNPVVKSAYEVEAYKEWLNTENEAISSMIQICKEYMNSYYYNAPFIGSDNAHSEVGQIIVNVLKGTSIEKAFQDALKNCQ